MICWDGHSGSIRQNTRLPNNWTTSLSYSADQQKVCVADIFGSFAVYLNNTKKIESFEPLENICTLGNAVHSSFISAVKFVVQSDSKAITVGGDKIAGLWDVGSSKLVSQFKGHTAAILCLAVDSSNPHNFITGGCDKCIKLWDTREANCVSSFYGSSGDVNSICYFPNQTSFISGSDDSCTRLFDIRSHRNISAYQTPRAQSAVTSVACTKSGNLLFSGFDLCKVIVWDTLLGVPVQALEGHENAITCIQMAPDGRALLSGSGDGKIKLWA